MNSDINDPTPGIAGVTMYLMPGNITTNTDEDGYYSFYNLPMGMYWVSPSLSGWLFAPSQYQVDLTSDATVNFVGTLGSSDYFVTISNISVLQSASKNVNAVFTIRLSKLATFPVIVNYKTQDGSATAAGNDYVAVMNGTSNFNAGELEKTVTIVVRPGPWTEETEYFKVVLFNPLPSPTIKLLPNADFGTGTILIPTDFIFLPIVRK